MLSMVMVNQPAAVLRMSFSKETLKRAPAGSVGILKLQTQQAAPDSFGFWIVTSRRELVGVSIFSPSLR